MERFLESIVDALETITVPEKVKELVAGYEDEERSELWFYFLQDKVLSRYILIPRIKPRAFALPILSFAKNSEFQECLDSTGLGFLEYMIEEYPKSPLKKFIELEYSIRLGEYTKFEQVGCVYEHAVEELEKLTTEENLRKNQDFLSDFFKMLLFTRSAFLNDDSFREFMEEKETFIYQIIM